jgi:hypothetical protein
MRGIKTKCSEVVIVTEQIFLFFFNQLERYTFDIESRVKTERNQFFQMFT